MPLLHRRPTCDLQELRDILQCEDSNADGDGSETIPATVGSDGHTLASKQESPNIPTEETNNRLQDSPQPTTNGKPRDRKSKRTQKPSRTSSSKDVKKSKMKPSPATHEKPQIETAKCSSSDSVSSIDFDEIEAEGDTSVSHPHHLPLPQGARMDGAHEDLPSSSHPSSTRSRLKRRPHVAAPKLVSNEERLAKKYNELATLLCRDVVKETAQICQESLRESRLLLQNTLAANRMVSHTLTDGAMPHAVAERRNHESQLIGWGTSEGGTTQHRSRGKSPSKPRAEEDSSHASWTMSLITPPRERSTSTSRKDQLMGKSFPSPTPRGIQKHSAKGQQPSENEPTSMEDDFSRQLAREEERRRQRSDNHLSATDNTLVRKWLRRKNRLLRQQKREKRENERFEKELDMELEKIRAKRQDMAKEAFQEWSQKKILALRTKANRVCEPTSNERISDSLSKHEEELRLQSDEDSPRKSPYHNGRPVHNYVFHRPSSSIANRTGSIHMKPKSTRMQVAGKRMITQSDSQGCDTSPMEEKRERLDATRLSYDEWLRRKRAQSARERSVSKTREATKTSVDGPETEEATKWNETIRNLARERRVSRERAKKRVDSGIGKGTTDAQKTIKISADAASLQHRLLLSQNLPSVRPKSAKLRTRKPLLTNESHEGDQLSQVQTSHDQGGDKTS